MTGYPTPSFEELLTTSQPRIRSYIASLLGNADATWDVLQETNKVLVQKQAKYQPGSSFLNWALTIAQFQTMAWLRDQKRDRHILTPEIVQLVSVDQEVRRLSHVGERMNALDNCLNQLSMQNRNVINRRYVLNESLAQLETATGKSVNQLKQVLFRLRKRLARCVQDHLRNA